MFLVSSTLTSVRGPGTSQDRPGPRHHLRTENKSRLSSGAAGGGCTGQYARARRCSDCRLPWGSQRGEKAAACLPREVRQDKPAGRWGWDGCSCAASWRETNDDGCFPAAREAEPQRSGESDGSVARGTSEARMRERHSYRWCGGATRPTRR